MTVWNEQIIVSKSKPIKMPWSYPCGICDEKLKEGYGPKNTQYGFWFICSQCWRKGWRHTKNGKQVNIKSVVEESK